jgi:hypothetical protein
MTLRYSKARESPSPYDPRSCPVDFSRALACWALRRDCRSAPSFAPLLSFLDQRSFRTLPTHVLTTLFRDNSSGDEIKMKRTFAATFIFATLSLSAVAQDWYHDREDRFRGEGWRPHIFMNVKTDLEHTWSAVKASDQKRKRLETTEGELAKMQADLDQGRRDNGILNDVIDSIRKSSNDSRLSERDRAVLADDLGRLKEFQDQQSRALVARHRRDQTYSEERGHNFALNAGETRSRAMSETVLNDYGTYGCKGVRETRTRRAADTARYPSKIV